LLSVFLTWLVQHQVSKPLKMLMKSSAKVGSGKFDIQYFEKQPKEIRSLAKAMQHTDQTIIEKAHALERLAKVVQQADEAVIMTDIHSNIKYVNPAFELISGYKSHEVLGKKANIVKSDAQDAAYYAAMWDTLMAGKVWRQGIKNRRKDGELYEVIQSISPLFHINGDIEGFVAIQSDVTQQRKVEDKLHHTDRVESLGVLAGGIAHDFNNLLTAILGNAALAMKKLEHESPAYSHLDSIEAASHSAADLCRQMLAYSGQGRFVVKPVNLNKLLENMGKLIDVSIAKHAVVRYQLSDDLPLIDADVAQVQQVILNLMTNASEALGEQSGTISLATGSMDVEQDYLYNSLGSEHLDAGHYVYLEVSDTGCGMDEGTKKKIFDPFFTTKFTGRGLGMSAMLGIVKGHQGALRLYSEKGKGTTICVLFPQGQHQQEVEQVQPETVPLKDSGLVLVVDDEEGVREVATAMLEDIGYKVLTAVDGEHAIEVYQKHQDDILFVVLDMTMPKMNGEACFRRLRQINHDVKVLLSSGYNEQEATSRFAGKGLAGFIQKPYTPQALSKIIADIIAI